MDQERTDYTPSKHRPSKHGDGGVQTDQHSRANKGWGPLYVPSPILDIQSPIGVATPDIEPVFNKINETSCLGRGGIPCEDMPIIHDTYGII
jgi:hypothetical protein